MNTNTDSRSRRINIFTDASCFNKMGVGGVAAIIREGKNTRVVKRSTSFANINRAELSAVIEGLLSVPPGSLVKVFSDSKYVVSAVNEGYLSIWRTNGWKRIRSGEPIKNADQWKKLCSLIEEHHLDVSFVKIKAHTNHYFNNRADQLAKREAVKETRRQRMAG